MKNLSYSLTLLIALLPLSVSDGAELMLREQATQNGALIRLGDIADISASTATELKDLASTPLLPAPAPGTQQFLTVPQVRDLLAARGVNLDQLTINGAGIVELGTSAAKLPSASKPLPPQLSKQEVEQHVKQVIERYLQARTEMGSWRVELSLNEQDAKQIAELGPHLNAETKSKPRSGRLRFTLTNPNREKRHNVLASITKIQSVVVVRRRIESGQLVRASDLEIREREGNLPTNVLFDLEQAIGKETKRALRPDEVVQSTHLREAWLVRRGETVNVYVRTGSIVVRSTAIAKTNGARGDLIVLETLEDKKRIDASVSGYGEVTVFTTGGRATDHASLQRKFNNETLRR